MNTRRTIALAATVGTLAAFSRIPFAILPNVQPASALIILAGATLGWRVGGLAGLLLPLISNAFLGHGPWTIMQAIGWGTMGATAGLLSPRASRWQLAAFGLVAGLAFGLIADGWIWIVSIRPLAWHTLAPVLAKGLPFNLLHAGGNALILWIVGPRLATLLRRARAKRVVEPFEEPSQQDPSPS